MKPPTFNLQGIRERNHAAFARKLSRSCLAGAPDVVDVSLQGSGPTDFLTVEDLATLTATIGRLARQGVTVNVQWPRAYQGKPSRIQKLLEGTCFFELFASGPSWTDHVVINGRKSSRSSTRPSFTYDVATAHYIPMMWLDASSFGVNCATSDDYWLASPRLPTKVNTEVRDLIHQQGFLDGEAIDALLHVIFMELGWNSILHSEETTGAGVALFCGQIEHPSDKNQLSSSRLTFCFADSGMGVPAALGRNYDNCSDPERQYHTHFGSDRETGIIRYALERDTTSRPPTHASPRDEEGCRGLAYVIRSLEGRGDLTFRSDKGAILVSGTTSGAGATPERFNEEYLGIPGTQVTGHLLSKEVRSVSRPGSESATLKDEVHSHGFIDLSEVLEREPTESEIAKELVAQSVGTAIEVVIVDFGCRELKPRTVEYVCKQIADSHSNCVFVLWNVRIDWAVLAGLGDWLLARRGTEPCPIFALVRQPEDAVILGYASSEQDALRISLNAACPWLSPVSPSGNEVSDRKQTPVHLSLADYLTVARVLNTRRLENAFERKEKTAGCYQGRIHLLNGEIVTRYFSFAQNISGNRANLECWLRSVQCGLELAIRTAVPIGPVVVLGFASTVRDMIQRLWIQRASEMNAFTILSYDLPSVEELRTVVPKEAHVVVITDVLSTGSSAMELISQVRNVGATPISLITAVDARPDPGYEPDLIVVQGERFPLLSCGRLNIRLPRTAQLSLPFEETEYWTDPVSMVPQEKRSELWDLPRGILDRIDHTLEAIEKTNCVRSGHCVDGTRHMSTFVDVRALIESGQRDVFAYVRGAIEDRLTERGWSGFRPSHIVAPTGISRIEPASPEAESEVTVYRTAASLYSSLLRNQLWNLSREVKVQRAFDPGGNSRCAHITQSLDESMQELGDVVIADDGMWTGRTANSLLRGIVEAGAMRVLIVPLLSRLRATETVHWESLTSVSDSSGREVQVCFFFPFLFPVPAYSYQECPYVITSKRIEKRASSDDSLQPIARRRQSELAAKTPSELRPTASIDAGTWARLRCYLELASEHEFALEEVRKILDRELQSVNEVRTNSILEQALVEWPIINRSRIRQVISPLIRDLATKTVNDAELGTGVKITACSVLRSLFKVEFARIVPRLADSARSDIDLLERNMFHVATLDKGLRSRPSVNRFLKQVTEVRKEDLQSLRAERIDRYTSMLDLARTLLIEASVEERNLQSAETPTKAAEHLLQLLVEDGVIQHELRPFLLTMVFGQDNLKLSTQKTWKTYYETWTSILFPVLTEEVAPRLTMLAGVLRRSLTPIDDLVAISTEYLVGANAQHRSLLKDVATIDNGLKMLAKGIAFDGTIDLVGEASRRISERVCGTRRAIHDAILVPNLSHSPADAPATSADAPVLSTLAHGLLMLRRTRIGAFLDQLVSRLSACLESRNISSGPYLIKSDELRDEDWIFTPSEFLERVQSHITANLHDYGLLQSSSTNGGTASMVEVAVSSRDNDQGERLIHVVVRNSGRRFLDGARQGPDGRRLNSTMEIFGGAFPPPRRCELNTFDAEQSVVLKIWSAEIDESAIGGGQERYSHAAP